MKKLKDLKVGDKFYHVNNGLGVCILTATNVLDCMSNERMKVEMNCGDARWSSIYGWRESSALCDDIGGTFYFDKAEVVDLLQDAIDDIKTTLKSLQDGN